MQSTFDYPKFAHRPITDCGARHRVVIVGGGMVGLTAALDLARHGVRSVLLDDDETVSIGSRAICFAKRTLEIYGRLGVGSRALEKVSFGTREKCSSAREKSMNSICGRKRATNIRRS